MTALMPEPSAIDMARSQAGWLRRLKTWASARRLRRQAGSPRTLSDHLLRDIGVRNLPPR